MEFNANTNHFELTASDASLLGWEHVPREVPQQDAWELMTRVTDAAVRCQERADDLGIHNAYSRVMSENTLTRLRINWIGGVTLANIPSAADGAEQLLALEQMFLQD